MVQAAMAELFNPLVPGMQNVKFRQFIIGCLFDSQRG